MIESAGELLASARYWGARSIAEGSADYARLAATLSAGARQCERDAWQLSVLENAARPASSDHAWLLGAPAADDGGARDHDDVARDSDNAITRSSAIDVSDASASNVDAIDQSSAHAIDDASAIEQHDDTTINNASGES